MGMEPDTPYSNFILGNGKGQVLFLNLSANSSTSTDTFKPFYRRFERSPQMPTAG
jgi:hypothetical protein